MPTSEKRCAHCNAPIVHREEGSGRHRWRYCSDECKADAARARAHIAKGHRPIRRIPWKADPPSAD